MRPNWLHRASQSASEGTVGHIRSRGEFHETAIARITTLDSSYCLERSSCNSPSTAVLLHRRRCGSWASRSSGTAFGSLALPWRLQSPVRNAHPPALQRLCSAWPCLPLLVCCSVSLPAMSQCHSRSSKALRETIYRPLRSFWNTVWGTS